MAVCDGCGEGGSKSVRALVFMVWWNGNGKLCLLLLVLDVGGALATMLCWASG